MGILLGIAAAVLVGAAIVVGWMLFSKMPKPSREFKLTQASRMTRRVLRSARQPVRVDAQDVLAIITETEQVRIMLFSEDHRLNAALLTDMEKLLRVRMRILIVIAYFAPDHIVADARGRGFPLVMATNQNTFASALRAHVDELTTPRSF